jgi:hypothetical protein
MPAERRDWVEAVWAEAHEEPPGLRRLAWRAGGVRLIAREALMRRGIGNAMLFAVAAALIPAKNVIEQVLDEPPGGGADLRLYRLIADSGFGNTCDPLAG